MNTDLFGTQIYEVNNGGNAGYILEDADMFYDIGFRVMKNQNSANLLECHKLKYNGKIKFVYFTDGLVSLEQVARSGDQGRITAVFRNLLIAVTEVANSGFMNIACIDSRISRIYVDLKDYSIRLIYLPINATGENITRQDFENIVRAQFETVQPGSVAQAQPQQMPQQAAAQSGQGQWMLVSLANGQSIPITKDYFKIGKSAEKADGIISWNAAISRAHCEVAFGSDGSVFIRDLKSANGTFVDGVRITDNPFVPINESSQIKLANELFTLRR